jgi:hypothetical protein
MLLSLVSSLTKGVASLNWTSINGEVTSSGIEETELYDGEDTYTGYCPSVSYEYVVNGKSYRADRIGVIRHCGDSRDAGRAAAAYPIGHPVEVHYAPDNPADALLEVGFSLDILGFIAVIVVMEVHIVGKPVWAKLKRPSQSEMFGDSGALGSMS